MATTRSRQANKPRGGERMMMALRRSSAAGVLLSQAVARRVGLNSSDMECLDLILIDGPASAGEIGRRTGLTSGAVTGLIDRLEGKGLVERVADPRDRRKVLVRARPDKLARIAAMFEPLAAAMTDLMSRYTNEQLQTIAEFTERSADAALARVTELNREP